MRLSGLPLVLRMLAADESAPDNVPLAAYGGTLTRFWTGLYKRR
jgi:hypothetical protein